MAQLCSVAEARTLGHVRPLQIRNQIGALTQQDYCATESRTLSGINFLVLRASGMGDRRTVAHLHAKFGQNIHPKID